MTDLHETTTRRRALAIGPRTLISRTTTLTALGAFGAAVLLVVAVWNARMVSRAADDPPGSPLAIPASATCPTAQNLYVAPDGKPDALGSPAQPMELRTALSEKSPAKPCDTIWLRGGTYSGTFTTVISGTEGRPIVVRASPGERVVIDSASSAAPAITVRSSYLWLWGLEILSSDPQRTSAEPVAWPTDLRRGTGVGVAEGTAVKLINLIIHDLARGIEIEAGAVATELYGNLIFHNGWDGPQASNGNGVETQNQGPPQLIAENIIFNQYSHGLLALAATPIKNLIVEGNVMFNNGSPGRDGFTRDILIGGGSTAGNLVVRDNATYGGAQTFIGYGNGCAASTITGNYFVGSTPLMLEKCSATVKGNILVGQYGFGPLPQSHPDNSYVVSPPKGVIVKSRVNKYEPGRAHIVVYNWDKHSEVTIDLKQSGLNVGDDYEIRDAQNYVAGPVIEGKVTADTQLTVSMVNLRSAPLAGGRSVPHTSPEFGVFVVQKLGARGQS